MDHRGRGKTLPQLERSVFKQNASYRRKGVRLLWRNDEDSQGNSASGFPYATSPAARRRRGGAEMPRRRKAIHRR
jgi:hypothetical protein